GSTLFRLAGVVLEAHGQRAVAVPGRDSAKASGSLSRRMVSDGGDDVRTRLGGAARGCAEETRRGAARSGRRGVTVESPVAAGRRSMDWHNAASRGGAGGRQRCAGSPASARGGPFMERRVSNARTW